MDLFLHFRSPDAEGSPAGKDSHHVGRLFFSSEKLPPTPHQQEPGWRGKKLRIFSEFIAPSFLQPAGVTLGAGEIGILRIDVHEIVAFWIHLVECFATALRENEMT